MGFDEVLELPAEANPLTESILIHVLKGAASSNYQQLQTSTKQLQTWETQKHFYVYLQSAFIDQRLPLEVRHIAITQLKFGVEKYWRKSATHAIPREDKDVIKSRLLESGISEGNAGLALQNALVIAKIVRHEFPSTWPDAIQQLASVLRFSADPGAPPLHLPRSFLIALHIVKELSTGRLRSTKANLQAATPELLRIVGAVYIEKFQRSLALITGNDADEHIIQESLAHILLALKVARRLVVAGYECPNRDSEVQQFMEIVNGHFQQILSLLYTRDNALPASVARLLELNLLQVAKLHVELAQFHPVAFVLLQGPETVAQYWQLITEFGKAYGSKPVNFGRISADGDVEEQERHVLEKVSLRGILVLRACLKLLFAPVQTLKFSRDSRREEEKEQALKSLRDINFTDGFARQMSEVIIRQYFVFRASDLREWEEEPDEWEKREDGTGDDYDVSIRSCAEKLFLELAIYYKDIVIAPLLEVFRTVSNPQNEDVLLKDSVYTAVGLAAAVLRDHVDFDSFIVSTLAPEVQKRQPGYKIIRRRAAIVIGQWISVKISAESRPAVYEIFRYLLDNSDTMNDQVVRVTAGRQFKNVANDWDFAPQPFLPFAPDILSRLMSMIGEVELSETKMALLESVSVLVERLEHHITPYVDRIISLLPPLWDQSGQEHLMKQAILTILSRLFISMKATGAQYHALAYDIVRGAVRPDSDSQLYLLDDALELWLAIVTQTPTPSSPSGLDQNLLSLSEYLIPTLGLGSESFRIALEITEAYILLAPTHILSRPFLSALLKSLSSDLGTLNFEASGHVTNLIEKLIEAAEILSGVEAIRALTSEMVSSGFFSALIAGLKHAWEAHQTTGPKAMVNRVEGLVETDYFSLLARLTYASPETLIEALQATPEAAPPPSMPNKNDLHGIDATMTWLLDEWLAHTEDVSALTRRKLMCLALTRLLDLHAPFVLLRLQSLMSMWTDVLIELTDDSEAARGVDCLVYPDSAFDGTGPRFEAGALESPHEGRKRVLARADPVHRVNVIEAVREAVVRCVVRCGGEDRFREDWLVNVDKEVVAAFGALGIL